jgi:dephospho-CoA kinase
MLKVGLTGGIATGKSFVLSVLAEVGCEVIDADKLAHQAIEPGQTAYFQIIEAFGEAILQSDGRIDRQKLGSIVFGVEDARLKLNSIVHPRVFEAQQKWFEEVKKRNPDAIAVVDAALMIETGSYKRFDCLVVVHCAPESQLERLMKRNNLGREAALKRIESQMPSKDKLMFADYVIDTSGTMEGTREQVGRLYRKLRKLAEEKRNGEMPA